LFYLFVWTKHNIFGRLNIVLDKLLVIKWKTHKKYHTVGTVQKYHTVGTVQKYHTVGTVQKYHTVGTVQKYHTVGTVLKYHTVATVQKYHTVEAVPKYNRKIRSRRMVVGFTTIYAISAYYISVSSNPIQARCTRYCIMW
jgi:hypothetical protein